MVTRFCLALCAMTIASSAWAQSGVHSMSPYSGLQYSTLAASRSSSFIAAPTVQRAGTCGPNGCPGSRTQPVMQHSSVTYAAPSQSYGISSQPAPIYSAPYSAPYSSPTVWNQYSAVPSVTQSVHSYAPVTSSWSSGYIHQPQPVQASAYHSCH